MNEDRELVLAVGPSQEAVIKTDFRDTSEVTFISKGTQVHFKRNSALIGKVGFSICEVDYKSKFNFGWKAKLTLL